MPAPGNRVKRVHFGLELNWEEEASRSARRVEQRRQRKAKKKMDNTNREAQIMAIVTILMNPRMRRRLESVWRTQPARGKTDFFLDL